MSLAAKTEETIATTLAPAESPSTMTATATTPAISETANSTPVATPVANVAPAKTTVTDQPALATQEVVAEPIKNEDKPEESPRTGLLKEFQQRFAGVFPKKSDKGCENKDEKKSHKGTENKDEKKSHTSEDKKEDRDEDKEKEKSSKQRSVSRKRNSLLGGLGIGKKEVKLAAEEVHAGENTTATGSEQPQNTESVADKAIENESTTAHEAGTERPGLPKRTSIFDTFRSHFVKKDKFEATSPAKETEAVSDSAPVIPAVGTIESPAAETVAVKDVPEPASEVKTEKLTTKYEKRKSSLPFGLGLNKKEKVPSSDDETVEKPLSPFAKLRATVKSKASPKFIADKKEENSVQETKNEGESTKPSESKGTEATTNAATAVAAPA